MGLNKASGLNPRNRHTTELSAGQCLIRAIFCFSMSVICLLLLIGLNSCAFVPVYNDPATLPGICFHKFDELNKRAEYYEPYLLRVAKIGRGPSGRKHIELMEWHGDDLIPTDGQDTVVTGARLVPVDWALENLRAGE